MKTKTLVIAVIMMAFALQASYAACSNACSSSQYTCSLTTTSMTKGSAGTLTVSVTNQQSQSQSSITASLLGSWFTGDTISQVISSISSGESKSLDFTITPNTAGSEDVCVDMGGTCTADCTQVTVSSAADLSVVSLSTPSSATASQTFTVSATIQNGGTETAGSSSSVTATLEETSGKCTISSATKTIGTIGDSATTSESWSVTAGSSSGTCNFVLSVSGSPGGTDTESGSTTIPSASGGSSDSGSGSGSGGGGGGGGSALSKAPAPEGTTISTTEGISVIKIPSVAAGESAGVDIDNPAETGVRRIAFTASKALANISIEIKNLESTDKEAPEGKIHQYMEIVLSNFSDSDITAAEISFQVAKKWIADNGFATSDIGLMRYISGWSELATSESGGTAEHVYYIATTPGFSLFAVSAVKKAVIVDDVIQDNENIVNAVKDIVNDYGWYIALSVFVIALILGWMYYHGHDHLKEVKQQLGQGRKNEYAIDIRNRKSGYSFTPSGRKNKK
ncbi:MAG: PGF-pre-PGF domain-containing protein [Candidatus Aenigmarchaeota archaeon]|nr:PGF-pre-PGF domain-containing protein [Candidatus Aenigmarchaeota archaeon]